MQDNSNNDQANFTQPWYRQRPTLVGQSSQPFVLTRFISSKGSRAPPFLCVAAFPWHLHSLTVDGLYDNSADKTAELQDRWSASVQPWLGSVLVGSIDQAFIFRKSGSPLSLRIPPCSDESTERILGRDVKCVAWALDPRTWTTPLVILAVHGMIFVYDPATSQLISSLRGHGGEITCIAVHRTHPFMFLTTSRDQSTRLYDLRFSCRKEPNNLAWPPSERPSHAGAGFGLHITGSEGDGLGRCVAILAGGRSGGHQAAVLHAAWHPTEDLIATCGVDRAVKIWRMPYVDYKKVKEGTEHLAREDKPLFTTDLIHNARVLSIWWLGRDILISHSSPALMRGKSVDRMYEEHGTIAVWQWLGYDRYLGEGGLKPIMKGNCGSILCIQDWRNSESFKLLSVYSVPKRTTSIYVASSREHDPLLLVPDRTTVRIFNITRLNHRDVPLFPPDDDISVDNADGDDENDDDDDDEELERMTGAVRLGSPDPHEEQDEGEDNHNDPGEVYRRNRPEKKLFRQVQHWTADGRRSDGPRLPAQLPSIGKCQLAFGQRVLLAVGVEGSLYSWKLA